jgi:alkylmercury lyase
VTAKILETPSDSQALIRRAAFRLLLAHAGPIGVDQIAAVTGIETDRVSALLDELVGAGRVLRDQSGRIVGSAGISVTPDRHAIELAGRKFWTWCAYDILGIFGALGASGRALSPSPDGHTVEVHFQHGRPVETQAVLFRPDDELMTCCENVYEEWCPNSNLFADAVEAKRWAEERGMRGRIMELDEASDLGTRDWANTV